MEHRFRRGVGELAHAVAVEDDNALGQGAEHGIQLGAPVIGGLVELRILEGDARALAQFLGQGEFALAQTAGRTRP